ncbi:MAG: 50S ribosomal protein L23 [Firmicutes bacterium]|nr:50S ribosomal protein L23 [Bacillota bacterium]
MTKHDIIIRPIITEESMAGLQNQKYTFEVARNATKTQIKNAIQEIFKVKVLKVNTLRTPGKTRRMGKYVGRTPETKKAVVTLAPGSRIEFFEGLV